MADATHVARLRVATSGGRGAVTARALVEDALRCEADATGPAARRGVLVLRRLAAGSAHGRALRGRVAGRVRRGLAEAAADAVAPTAPGAAGADAVLFRDPFEVYRLFAQALFRRDGLAGAWFFKLIFGLRGAGLAGSGLAPAASAALRRAAAEPFAPLAIAEVLAPSGADLPEVLAALSDGEAEVLASGLLTGGAGAAAMPGLAMSAGGGANADGAAAVVPAVPPAARHAGRIARALAAEPRLCAAATALIRTLPPSSPRRVLAAAAILGAAGLRPSVRTLAEAIAVVGTSGAPRPQGRDAASAHGAAEDTGPERAPKPAQGDHRTEEAEEAFDTARGEARADRPARGTDLSAEPAGAAADAATSPGRPDAQAAPPDGRVPDRDRAAPAETAPADAAGRATETLDAARRPPPHDRAAPAEPEDPPAAAPVSETFGDPSAFAGIVLVQSAMHRVLAGLVDQPEAVDADIGRHLLWRLLRRLGCPETDPAARAVAPAEPDSTPPLVPFCLEAATETADWRTDRRLSLARVADAPGWRVLLGPGGRLAVAAWQGRAPAPVRALIAAKGVRRTAPQRFGGDELLTSAALLLMRTMWQTLQQRLADLAGRSGWVRETRAHLDVTFDAALVDLAVRRAGLDLSPGWCAWFGKVVTIHYDYGGQDA